MTILFFGKDGFRLLAFPDSNISYYGHEPIHFNKYVSDLYVYNILHLQLKIFIYNKYHF